MDPDPTPGPTPFFSDFNDANKIFSYFFSYNFPAGISLVLKMVFFCKNFVLKFYFASIISVCSKPLRMRKGKDQEPDPYP
jgi:hypothetical protein